MSKGVLLEVCVDSVESALAAQRGGAHRVELCGNLLEGGVTPSVGLIAAVRSAVSIALHVMIRPRAGDFLYSKNEIAIMRRDIAAAKEHGADGVVFGLLEARGNVDVPRTRRLVEFAAPLAVTFHRAFDMSSDLLRALRDLQNTGVHCVLTSGGRQTAAQGAKTLRRLFEAAGPTLAVMAGGGIAAGNVAALIQRTGVRALHASLKSPLPSRMRYRKGGISMGAAQGREYRRFVVTQERVRQLIRAVSNL